MYEKENVCLITGASRGLGRFLAEHFWIQGWSVILSASNSKSLQECLDSLADKPDQKKYAIIADLLIQGEAERMITEAKSLVSRLSLLINNAAIQGAVGPAWSNDWAEWQSTIQVDMIAPARICSLISPWMMETGNGSIINLSGGGATGPRANFSAYATAKAGLVRFSETLAEELRPYHIRVNCISPGMMGTSMMQEIVRKGETASGKKEYENAKRILREEKGESMKRVAELCSFLASESSKGITGKLISAIWDDWTNWPEHLEELASSDVYTLRRITGRDRGFSWGDK